MIRKNSLVPLIGLVVVAAISLSGCSGLTLGGGSSESSPKASATASATPSPSPTIKPASNKTPTVKDAESSATLDESLWGHLTWKYPTRFVDLITKYNGAAGMTTTDKVTRPTFVVCSNLPGRVWTDSVCLPIASKSMAEVYANILTKPDYGAHVGSGLAHSSIVGGKSLLELNPWLKEFADPAGINDWAQAAMDGSPAEQLIAAKKLVLVVLLLEQLNHESVGQHSTSFNYHLVVGQDGSAAMTVDPKNPNGPEDTVKEFELNPIQYVGEFVTVQLTYKGQTGCWLQVGFNTGDGRFAGFTCVPPTVTPPTKPPTTPPPTKPGCVVTATHSCTTPPTPGCKEKHNCYVPPKCTVPTDCLTPKDLKNDVVPPQGTPTLGPDPFKPVAPTAKPNPLSPTTPVTADSGTLVPVQGATPAPVSIPAPTAPQAPAPSEPATPVKDAG